jgi:hypothetical protein
MTGHATRLSAAVATIGLAGFANIRVNPAQTTLAGQ